MLSKKMMAIKTLSKNINILQCPICSSKLNIGEKNCLICDNNHSFDIAKNGVILLHKKYKKVNDEIYTENLFLNRRKFINKGYYDELHLCINEILKNQFNKNFNLLDLGSGDCTHLNYIKLNYANNVGIDLSYDAIKLATDYLNEDILPICADLYNLPFKNNSFDAVIDILSPINSLEINRILKDDGIIIKVIPGKKYLYELRKILGFDLYEKEEEIINNLSKNFNIIYQKHLINVKPINEQTCKELFSMTPLSNHKELDSLKLDFITIDLNVLVLNKKNKNIHN